MKRLLILGGILLSQNPAFSQYRCPSGTTAIGRPESREYNIAGWQFEKKHKCFIPPGSYMRCGDIGLYSYMNATYNQGKVLSKEGVWVNFKDIWSRDKPNIQERSGYNKNTGELYYQHVTTRFYTAPGAPKVLQISTFKEEIQKCGSYSF